MARGRRTTRMSAREHQSDLRTSHLGHTHINHPLPNDPPPDLREELDRRRENSRQSQLREEIIPDQVGPSRRQNRDKAPAHYDNRREDIAESGSNRSEVPIIGGKPVDLHHLFLEVTSRGGFEKVIGDRRWREVTAAFKFPSSLTSGTYSLRKCYLCLLYHFEQVYYFRREEPPTAVADVRSPSEYTNGSTALQAFKDASGQHSDGLDLEYGSTITGTIDAKFDNGYIVTVDLGSEKLNGILYHMPMSTNMSQALVPVLSTSGRKRRRKLAVEDSSTVSSPKSDSEGYS